MAFRRAPSPQTRAVLSALHSHPATWRHGYDISRETGLASGTLYPILGRLADHGLLATSWEDNPPEGRPRRHLYRLTAEGEAAAAAYPAQTQPERATGSRTALEGA
jgi:PadR family transcriptional regulator